MAENQKSPSISFYDNHLPILQDGEYTLQVSQKIEGFKEGDDKAKPQFNSNTITLYVNGPRFYLAPSELHTIYPNDTAKGDFEGTLPSISFTRSTLLWERDPKSEGKSDAPWLYLLLVDESELAQRQVITFNDAGEVCLMNHGFNDNALVYLENINGQLPERLSLNQPYYVKKIDNNKFNLTEGASLQPVSFSGIGSGTCFIMHGGIFEGKYSYAQLKGTGTSLSPIATSLGIKEYDDLKFIDQGQLIQFIDLSSFSTNVIPTLQELKYLGYTRIMDSEEDDKEEHCVAVGNRLPKPGSNSTVYLISLENKYNGDNLDTAEKIFPVLQKWTFHTNDDQLYSIQLNLEKIKAIPKYNELHIADDVINDTAIYETKEDFEKFLEEKNVSAEVMKKMFPLCKLPGGSFHDVMSNLKNGCRSISLLEAAVGTLESTGSVNLPSQTIIENKPNKGRAYYRGPLVARAINLNHASFSPDQNLNTGKTKPLFIDNIGDLIPQKAEELKITRTNNEIDVSYVAAFELGKLTALNDTAFSAAFFEWKHEVAAAKAHDRVQSQIDHLPIQIKYNANLEMPNTVKEKFINWSLLKGIPIRYLVPDPTMVPTECIRYFKVDNNWVNAFIMGAFSIGHTVRTDFTAEIKKLFVSKEVTGFILNSLAVSVWHDYELDCTTSLSGNATATPLRKSNLDKFTHIYLFDGQISQLKFHLHPGKLHPGFMVEKTMEGTTYHKSIGDCTNYINQASRVVSITTPKPYNSTKSLSFLSALTGIPDPVKGNPGSVGKFNSQLMEGTPEVVFKLIDANK